MKRALYTLLFAFVIANSYAQPCQPWGSAPVGSRRGNLNELKNHAAVPPADSAQDLELSSLLATPHGEDSDRFKNGTYVYTEGYLVSHKEEGAESCNCKEATAEQKNGDVHIYIGQSPDAPKSDCIIVEITPAFKRLHLDYNNLLIAGEHVRITGYLLYDFEHVSNAVNTCKKCTSVWRKTCWEIHPIVGINKID